MPTNDIDETHDDFRHLGPEIKITQTFGKPETPAPAALHRSGLSILRHVFGAKRVTTATIDDRVAAANLQIKAEQDRRDGAAAKLARPALLSDEDHEQAESDAASARRAIARHEDLIAALEAERATIATAEAREAVLREAEALKVRTAAARKGWAQYEHAARQIADHLTEVRDSWAAAEELRKRASKLGVSIPVESTSVTHVGADFLDIVNLPALDGSHHWRMNEPFVARRFASLA